jgi:hypothetical protein
MPSVPGDFNRVELIGTIWEVVHAIGGDITAVTLYVHAGEKVLIPIIADTYPPGITRGDRVWIKGSLQSEKIGHKYLHYVRPQHWERLKPGVPRQGATPAASSPAARSA